MYFILICCFSMLLISFIIYKYIKLQKKNDELQSQIIIKGLSLQRYQKEMDRLNEQLKVFEKIETENLKAHPTKIGNTEITYNSLFEGKKSIIGNYDNFSTNITRMILRNYGLSVDIVKTADDLYDKVNLYNYDIIFTNNIYKQSIDGPELLKKLKKLDGFNTPVVIHTISKNKRQYFIDTIGFDEYIEKPIQINEIERILKKLL